MCLRSQTSVTRNSLLVGQIGRSDCLSCVMIPSLGREPHLTWIILHLASTSTERTTAVLHNQDNAITVLDTNGGKVRKIVIMKAFGRVIELGFDIHMDKVTHAIYVPCWMSDDGVLCVSVEGEPLWFTKLAGLSCGITEINGFPCVAVNASRCLFLMSKNGENKRKLLDNDFNDAECTLFCFESSSQKIFFVLGEKCIICAYKVEK